MPKQLVTPEIKAVLNQQNVRVLKDFSQELKQQKRSAKTIMNYESDIMIFFYYLWKEKENINVLKSKRKDFRDFSLWMQEERGVSSARVNRVLSAVRSMLTYCEMDDDIDYDNNLARHVKGPKKEAVRGVEDDTYYFIPFEKIMQIRSMLVEDGEFAMACLISVAYDMGCRRGEIIQVKRTALKPDANVTNVVRAKGGKTYRIHFLKDTRELIDEYLLTRDDDNEMLFYRKGKAIDYDSVYYLWKRALHRYNVKYNDTLDCPFHAIRHSRIDHLANAEDTRLKDKEGNTLKMDLQLIRQQMNHSSVAITEYYMKDRTAELLDEFYAQAQM